MRLLTALRALIGDARGQITLSLALMILPICLTAGSALDYGMVLRARTALQLSLDSASLAATATRDGSLDPAVARSYFVLNGSLEGVTIQDITFKKLSSGAVEATVTANVPAIFMRIVRSKDYTIRLTSTTNSIPQFNSWGTFSVQSIKGVYDKDIYYYAQNNAGTVTKKSLYAVYDYFYDSALKRWRASLRIVNPVPGYTLEKGETTSLMVVVYLDPLKQGQKFNPDELGRFDTDASSFLKIEGTCTSATGITYSWEETRDKLGDFKDVVMRLTCNTTRNGARDVRLSK